MAPRRAAHRERGASCGERGAPTTIGRRRRVAAVRARVHARTETSRRHDERRGTKGYFADAGRRRGLFPGVRGARSRSGANASQLLQRLAIHVHRGRVVRGDRAGVSGARRGARGLRRRSAHGDGGQTEDLLEKRLVLHPNGGALLVLTVVHRVAHRERRSARR